jgi:hypothetical protein
LGKYLLKKVRETWDYAVSNQIVYGPKTIREAISFTWPFIAENYVKMKTWFEIFFIAVRDGCFQEYIAVIEFAQRRLFKNIVVRPLIRNPMLKTKVSMSCDNGNMSMLFNCPKSMQSPQGVILRPLPPVVWLCSLNNLACLRWNICGHLAENMYIRLFKNREASLIRRVSHVSKSKLPSQMLQGRPQVVNSISCEQTHPNRKFFKGLIPIDIEKILRIEFDGN